MKAEGGSLAGWAGVRGQAGVEEGAGQPEEALGSANGKNSLDSSGGREALPVPIQLGSWAELRHQARAGVGKLSRARQGIK